MNLVRWSIAAAVFAAFWCAGLLLRPRIEAKLTTATHQALAGQQPLIGRLDRVKTAFHGQTAHLTGQVRSAQDKAAIETVVREHVRAPTAIAAGLGQRLNPVAAVRNDIEIVPFPPGWMVLAANGTEATLLGEAATDYEARDLARTITESWSAAGGRLRAAIQATPVDHDEAADISATLGGMPQPSARVELHLARIGSGWQQLQLTQDDDRLRGQAGAVGVPDDAWEKDISPVLTALRRHRAEAEALARQEAQQAKLPPGHLFLALRDQHLVLRGEVGSPAVKRALLSEALQVFHPLRIHDDIRVNTTRRPVADFAPLSTALLPAAGTAEQKSFHLGIGGEAWQPLGWQGSRRELSWKGKLPSGLPPALLGGDNASLIDFLQGSDAGLPAPARTQPAFLVLALFDGKALLSGQIAEPALHARMLAAVRSAYAPGIMTSADFFTVRGRCQPSEELLHAAQSLPRPGLRPLLAFARPGGSWKTREITPALIEPGALAKSGLIPDDIPHRLVEEVAADTLEQLRAMILHPESLIPKR
jgi:hypothetical protein